MAQKENTNKPQDAVKEVITKKDDDSLPEIEEKHLPPEKEEDETNSEVKVPNESEPKETNSEQKTDEKTDDQPPQPAKETK